MDWRFLIDKIDATQTLIKSNSVPRLELDIHQKLQLSICTMMITCSCRATDYKLNV